MVLDNTAPIFQVAVISIIWYFVIIIGILALSLVIKSGHSGWLYVPIIHMNGLDRILCSPYSGYSDIVNIV